MFFFRVRVVDLWVLLVFVLCGEEGGGFYGGADAFVGVYCSVEVCVVDLFCGLYLFSVVVVECHGIVGEV